MNLNDTKSSETIRKEITQDLDRLDHKVDRLKERLTPGQIIDDAVFSPYKGNPRASLNYMKSNPVGTTFLALGTFLLMESEGESYEQYIRSQGLSTYRNYKSKVSQTTNQLGEKVESISQEVRSKTQDLVNSGERGLERARETGRGLKDQVNSLTENVKERLSKKGPELRSKVSDGVDSIRNEVSEVRDNVIDASESFKERSLSSTQSLQEEGSSGLYRMKDSISSFGRNTVGKIKETEMDSLSYVALGAAMGFATGGLIPLSEEEISNMSTDFDLSSLRSELQQAANESIGAFKNEIIDTLKNSNIDIF